jgi:hypothetical protein
MIKGMRQITIAVLGVVTATIASSTRAQSPGETVFVMSNAVDRNEVIAFSQAADGHFNETGRYDCGSLRLLRSSSRPLSTTLAESMRCSTLLALYRRSISLK